MKEAKLIKAVQKGDHAAFRKVFDRYSDTLMGMAWRYARNEADAQDILQESFIRIYTRIRDYEGKGSFEGWMKRILVTTAINFLKKRQKETERTAPEGVEEHEVEDENIPDNIAEKELLEALNELPDGYRMVFNLNVIEGYAHKEIAEMTGISEGTSQSQLFKAKKMLRERLTQDLRMSK